MVKSKAAQSQVVGVYELQAFQGTGRFVGALPGSDKAATGASRCTGLTSLPVHTCLYRSRSIQLLGATGDTKREVQKVQR